MANRQRCQIVKEAFLTRQFGEQHHADEEQIDSSPLPTAETPSFQGSSPNLRRRAAPAAAQTNSGIFHGRAMTPSTATPAIK